MKKILIPLAVVIILGAAAFFLFQQQKDPESDQAQSQPALNGQPDTAAGLPNQQLPAGAPPSPAGVRPEFVELLKAEAKAMDAPNIDAEEIEQRIGEEAARMGPNEMQYALRTAQNTEAVAGERILAAFLLTLGQEKAWPYLRELVLTPVQERGGEHNSLDEVKTMQEKALQQMAIEGLAEQAITNPQAREELRRLGAEAREPRVRQAIQRALKDLPPLSQ